MSEASTAYGALSTGGNPNKEDLIALHDRYAFPAPSTSVVTADDVEVGGLVSVDGRTYRRLDDAEMEFDEVGAGSVKLKELTPLPRAETLAELRAMSADNFAIYELSEAGIAGEFRYEESRAPYVQDGVIVVKLDDVPLTTGALVRVPTGGLLSGSDPLYHDIRPAGAVVRIPSGASPVAELVNDATHGPHGFGNPLIIEAPDPNAGSLHVPLSRPSAKNVTHIAQPDETYGLGQVTTGIRGTTEGPYIFGFRPMEFSVNLGSGAVAENSFFDGEVTRTVEADGSTTLTHPPIASAMTPAIVENTGSGYLTRVISSTNDSIRVQNFVPLSARFRQNGAGFTLLSSLAFLPTANFDTATGVVTVTLNQTGYTLPNGFHRSLIVAGNRPGAWFTEPVVASDRLSFSFAVVDATGAPLTTINDTDFSFSFPDWLVPSSVRAGTIRVRRGVSQFDMAKAGNSSGNFWVKSLAADQLP